MTWADRVKFRLQIAAIIFVFMGPGFLIWLAPSTLRQIASNSWPTVPGVVQELVAEREMNSEKKFVLVGRARYSYEVDGKEYASDQMSLAPRSQRSNHQEAMNDVSHYQAGMDVTVHFDPQDPSFGIIEPGIPQHLFQLLVGLIVVTVVSIVTTIFTLQSWLAKRRQRWAELGIDGRWDIQGQRRPTLPGEAHLGETMESFQPNRSTLYGYLIVAAVLLGLGIVVQGLIIREIYLAGGNLPFFVEKGMCWMAAGLGSLIGLAMLGGGAFLAWYIPRLFSYQVEICEHGLRERRGTVCQEIAWTDVAAIRASDEDCEVFRSDKSKLSFNKIGIADYKRFGAALRQQADRHGTTVIVKSED